MFEKKQLFLKDFKVSKDLQYASGILTTFICLCIWQGNVVPYYWFR